MERPATLCARYMATLEAMVPDGTVQPLEISDMAGIFIMQASARARPA